MASIAHDDVACFSRSSRMLQGLVLALGLGASTMTLADDAVRLDKAEVQAIAVGKRLSYLRTSDGVTMTFDIREGDRVYYTPARSQRNLSIGGTYTISDEGTLCFKWETDKYITMQDGCFVFKREDRKVHLYRSRAPDTPIGDLVE